MDTDNLDLNDFEYADLHKGNSLRESKLIGEQQVDIIDTDTYILHTSATQEANFNVAVGLSNNVCQVYHCDGNSLAKIETLVGHCDTITGCQFSLENNNILYSGSKDGVIKMWDLRISKKLVAEFKDTTSTSANDVKTTTCFDVSSNNRLLAAGTELYEAEAFILFWDVRNVKLLGGYWESHTDDITQVRFNPNDSNNLISGSTDGLINIYDLKQAIEDDSLTDSLNTESTIEQLIWYQHRNKDSICCITHTVDVQLWKTEDVQPYANFNRSDFAVTIKQKSEAHCYVVDAHKQSNDELLIVSGTKSKNKLLGLATKDNTLLLEYHLQENKQIVRSSWFNQYQKLLITGGENGILNVWQLN